MAQDATGTPTSLGIPTYNVGVDAPTGNGFNAAMASIDTLIKARISDPSTQNDGEPLVWDSAAQQWKPVHLKINDTTKYLRGDGTWATIATPASVPSGVVTQFGGVLAPSGWLMCDGTPASRTVYASLFAAVGTVYGAGDGSTTFNLPDLQGRVPVGKGPNASVSVLGGNDGQAAADRRPHHRTSNALVLNEPYPYVSGSGGTGATGVTSDQGWGAGRIVTSPSLTGSIGTNNGADAIDTPSYIILNYIIKT